VSKYARDARVRDVMSRLFAKAEAGEYTVDPRAQRQLEEVFRTTSWGFREILLVVVVARLLDGSYRASTALYDCNPRALYEGPMVDELRARGIPHRKSGPLNIAKAARGLDDAWAAQRRPRAVAQRVVELVRYIESLSRDELENFAVVVHARFMDEATRVADLFVEAEPASDAAFLFHMCRRLVDEAPDAGNTPQRIVGLLMRAYHDELQTGLRVGGYEDRASVTSTTSKKPGDVTEEQLDGTIVAVYEVTVKPFAEQRVRESYDTVRAFDALSSTSTAEVIVICRREDVHPDAADLGATGLCVSRLDFQDLTYLFVDIYGWMMSKLISLPPDARRHFHEQLSAYVQDINTSETVKRVWAEIIRDATD